MALLFHAPDVLFSLGVVILLCVGVVLLFSTLARRVGGKMQKRHHSVRTSAGRRKSFK